MSPVKDERRPEPTRDETQPDEEPYGSVLGIIDSDPSKKLPRVAKDTGGHPKGIELDSHDTGLEELPPTAGYSSDFGAGGQTHEPLTESNPLEETKEDE